MAAFSIFGIKVGLGLASQIYSHNVSSGRKAILFAGALVAYIALFSLIYYVTNNFNLLNYLDEFMKMIKYGMALHLTMAVGLLAWGARLLLQDNENCKSMSSCRASLLLITPCPVCAAAILLNLTFAYSLSGLTPILTTIIIFIIFFSFILLTAAFIFPFRKKIGSGNNFLGLSMGLISLYFFLTIVIAPIYQEVKDVFRMNLSSNPVNQIDYSSLIIFSAVVFLLIGAGFIKGKYFARGISK